MVSSKSNVAAHSVPPLLLYKISVFLCYVKLVGGLGGRSSRVWVDAFGQEQSFAPITFWVHSLLVAGPSVMQDEGAVRSATPIASDHPHRSQLQH